MNTIAALTVRESEIAELFAWGASKKEIANRLNISIRTIENHARNIYDKINCSKVNELSAWWFCVKFKISFDLSPLKRKVVSLFMLLVLVPQIYTNSNDMIRHAKVRIRTLNVRTCRTMRKNETNVIV